VHRRQQRYSVLPDMRVIREACWREQALQIHYTDRNGDATERRIWPLAIVYHNDSLVVLARCCLRDDFRIFRAERIARAEPADESFRPRRVVLLREYLALLTKP
jgi:predicted DNA-binding transcriptional regulator YafY